MSARIERVCPRWRPRRVPGPRHEEVYGGSTGAYIDTRNWKNFFAQRPRTHREYVELPTPAQLQRKLKGSIPPAMVGKRFLKEVFEQRARERLEALIALEEAMAREAAETAKHD